MGIPLHVLVRNVLLSVRIGCDDAKDIPPKCIEIDTSVVAVKKDDKYLLEVVDEERIFSTKIKITLRPI